MKCLTDWSTVDASRGEIRPCRSGLGREGSAAGSPPSQCRRPPVDERGILSCESLFYETKEDEKAQGGRIGEQRQGHTSQRNISKCPLWCAVMTNSIVMACPAVYVASAGPVGRYSCAAPAASPHTPAERKREETLVSPHTHTVRLGSPFHHSIALHLRASSHHALLTSTPVVPKLPRQIFSANGVGFQVAWRQHDVVVTWEEAAQ